MSPLTRWPTGKEIDAVRREYLHIRDDSELRINTIENADCIAAQAFGRNFWDDAVLNREIQAFTASTFTDRRTDAEIFELLLANGFNDPGRGNSKLALFVKRATLARDFKIPLFLQWEISLALFLYEREFWNEAKKRTKIYSLYPSKGDNGYRTYHAVRDTRRLTIRRNLDSPLVIALAPMLPRAIATFWNAGLNTVVMPDSFYGNTIASNWDPCSVQRYTRSIQAFKNRERIIRLGGLLPFRFGPFGYCSLTPPK